MIDEDETQKCADSQYLIMFEKLWIGSEQLKEFGDEEKGKSKIVKKRNFKKRIFSNFSTSDLDL